MIALLLSLILSPTANATKILYFGDSHSVATYGPFGIYMNKFLRELPKAEVTAHARCGSVIAWWYNTHPTTCGYFDKDSLGNALPKLQPADAKHPKGPYYPSNAPTPKIVPMIQDLKPELLLVEMGGNYLLGNDPVAAIKKEVGQFIADVNAYKRSSNSRFECVWVGPPAHRVPTDPKNPQVAIAFKKKIQDIVATLKATVEPTCEFFDSTLVTEYPAVGGDGTHYSFPDGIKVAIPWIDQAFEVVKTRYAKISDSH